MKKSKYFILLVCFLSNNQITYSQSKTSQEDLIENLIEAIAEQNEEQFDYSNLLDELNELLQNPINLNTTTANELEKLVILNQNQIENLLNYRKTTGQIFSLFELQLVPGFSYELIRSIEPFVSVEKSNESALENKRAKHILFLKTERTLEKEKGYSTKENESNYTGSEWKLYKRYQYTSSNRKLLIGITSEKDKGEPFFKGENSSGFDYYSGHIQYNLQGIVKQINLGDYQVKFGQGLNLWAGLSSGKSSFTTQNANKSQGIKSYKSTNENQFLRGVSVLLQPTKNSKFAVFVSNIKKDGTLNSDSINPYISSIINTGLHRTESEFEKKGKLDEKLIGSYFTINFKNIEFGASFLQTEYSPRIWNNKEAYQYFNFNGNKNSNLSLTYETQMKSMHLFGEIAQSKSGGRAIIQGANIQLHPQINIECIYRKYDPDYHSFHSNAFAEQSKTQNEEGFYFGVEFHPIPKWTMKAYYDQFRFPWLRFSSNSPSDGHEYFSQLEFTPNRTVSAYFRYKQENKKVTQNTETIINLVEQKKNQYRFHISAKLNDNWEIRNRVEISQFHENQERESGYLLYQDLIYRFSKLPIAMNCRYAIFATDSFNSRIYAYENDVLHAYSIPAYFGKGNRLYLNLNWKLNQNFKLYLKYSQTKYSDRNTIGTGNSEINGNTKSEVKILLKCRF